MPVPAGVGKEQRECATCKWPRTPRASRGRTVPCRGRRLPWCPAIAVARRCAGRQCRGRTRVGGAPSVTRPGQRFALLNGTSATSCGHLAFGHPGRCGSTRTAWPGLRQSSALARPPPVLVSRRAGYQVRLHRRHQDRLADCSNLKRMDPCPTCLNRLRVESPIGFGNSRTNQRSGENTNGT